MNNALLIAKVMHKRFSPAVNQFSYGMYYLCTPLSQIHALNMPPILGINRSGLMSFFERDHAVLGANKNETAPTTNLLADVQKLLADYGISAANGEVVMVAFPRVCGYVFNPITVYFCLDELGALRATICEVNNTFGETHVYICAHADQRPILADDVLSHDKIFHVSPFLPREGSYQFRFAYNDKNIGVWIDYYDAEGKQVLITSLLGKRVELNRRSLITAFFRYPLVTLWAIYLIHFQALRLFFKRVRYIYKPTQRDQRISPAKQKKDS